MDQELAEKVFKEADKDGDGLITYVEYFTFIERYVCQTKAGKFLFICRIQWLSKITRKKAKRVGNSTPSSSGFRSRME